MSLDIIGRNVVDAVPAPTAPSPDLSVWTPDEAQRFSAVARTSHYGPIWFVLAATGMRRDEALGLRWQDVNWSAGMLHVRQQVVMAHGSPCIQPSKSRSAYRALPIEGWLLNDLRAHKTRQDEQRQRLDDAWHAYDLVFPSEVGTPINARNLDRESKKLLQRAGVRPIRIHDIRHTVATVAIASGLNPKAVSEHLAHSETSITLDIYTKVMAEQRMEVAKGIGAATIKKETNTPQIVEL